MASPIAVVAYDPEWVLIFEQIRDFVLPAVSDLVIGIEHVGSTSVPGLAAKPIIDVDVVVKAPEHMRIAVQRLAALGYVHEGDLGVTGREAFIPPQSMMWHHLYVVPVDNLELKRHLLFRDYLRSHPEEATTYGELKHELAHRFRDDRGAYSLGKSEYVTGVLQRAGWNG
ncbi:GrpB family protein [Paenibacillus qinlingensis]|uniref:GrpB-like predicted nucleotidyltransferase (UPF0157 family) n=1 Tax=Paenibacillus qinlingensis TaxID=1837343 RepID=A0ABU1P787_9BACL|nr:GrpB family protein [Paenibacillus qinlingensis]MDR6555628.1 GrpB-like predicted nucleotidyltransferase (UPF0157 family) [Paenibacillus qinlingensis]